MHEEKLCGTLRADHGKHKSLIQSTKKEQSIIPGPGSVRSLLALIPLALDLVSGRAVVTPHALAAPSSPPHPAAAPRAASSSSPARSSSTPGSWAVVSSSPQTSASRRELRSDVAAQPLTSCVAYTHVRKY
jgi:hypothetical protein